MKKKISLDLKRGSIVIYKTLRGGDSLEVTLDKETVWLNQLQMSQLFDKGLPAINEHIANIYKEKELSKNSTIRKFRIVQKEGNRKIERNINYYNLDVIISIGYRVKSQNGTRFRIWATNILRNHLIKGYTLNQKRLLEETGKLRELQQVISFIKDKSQKEILDGQEKTLLNLLGDYAKSLTLLAAYDEKSLNTRKKKKAEFKLNYSLCQEIIREIKIQLVRKKEAGSLFGEDLSNKLDSIVSSLYQTYDKNELYGSLEEKAAHLLYLIIKDHPFTDGNKRIGSLLFIYFLDKNNYLYKSSGEKKINDNALVALSLLIAESNPREKEVMVKIITNLL